MTSILINPSESVIKYDGTVLGQRIVDIANEPFPVVSSMKWITLKKNVVASVDHHYWDGSAVQEIPVNPNTGNVVVNSPTPISGSGPVKL
jgi:hypothetical protein